jgi:hypothetical protein
MLLFFTIGLFIVSLGVVAYYRTWPGPELRDLRELGLPCMIGSLSFGNGYYLALHWAFRSENVLGKRLWRHLDGTLSPYRSAFRQWKRKRRRRRNLDRYS